jgi:hypothetical protein
MSEMIERVARVLHARDDYDGYTWHDYIPDARAAIAAMREPTDRMVHVGTMANLRQDGFFMGGIWKNMIDAALEGK